MSQPTFVLTINTPTRCFWSGQATCLTIPLADGSMQILAHHQPEIALVHYGRIVIATPDGLVHLATLGGVMHVKGAEVVLLLEHVTVGDQWQTMVQEHQTFLAHEKARRQESFAESRLSAIALAKAFASMQQGPHTDD